MKYKNPILLACMLFAVPVLAAAGNCIIKNPISDNQQQYGPWGNINKILPVRILSFSAKFQPEQGAVTIHWVTARERMNVRFLVERSLDSLHFTTIGETKTLANNPGSQQYYFYDTHPVQGKLYYRLREIDVDQKQYLTQVVSSESPITHLELASVLPVREGLQLNFVVISPDSSEASVLVADIGGKVLKSFPMHLSEGANLKSIFIGDLSPALYFLQVNALHGGGSVIEKFNKD